MVTVKTTLKDAEPAAPSPSPKLKAGVRKHKEFTGTKPETDPIRQEIRVYIGKLARIRTSTALAYNNLLAKASSTKIKGQFTFIYSKDRLPIAVSNGHQYFRIINVRG